MHPRQPVPPAVLRLSTQQHQVVTREQALGAGLSRRAVDRLLRDDIWSAMAPGVYRTLPAGQQLPWLSLAWASCLLGGDHARLAVHAAAHLWQLCAEPEEIVVLLPNNAARPTPVGPWRFRRERPGVRDRRSVGSPPRTTLEDTVIDLVAADGDVVRWLTAALQSRRTSVRRLREAYAHRQRVARRADSLALLDELEAGAESALELRYLRDVERAHGLPEAERQVRRRGTVADVLYREFGLLVELDGRRGHDGEGRFRDMRRDNAATTDGLATLRYGWSDVDQQPCGVAGQVAENLIIRGWTGLPTLCRRCRRVA